MTINWIGDDLTMLSMRHAYRTDATRGIDDDNVDRNDILKYNQIQYIDWCIRIDSSYV